MNANTLNAFREIAATMTGPTGWQWIGPHMSQRMFDISESRAKDYARRFGGEAKPMEPAAVGYIRGVGMATAEQWAAYRQGATDEQAGRSPASDDRHYAAGYRESNKCR